MAAETLRINLEIAGKASKGMATAASLEAKYEKQIKKAGDQLTKFALTPYQPPRFTSSLYDLNKMELKLLSIAKKIHQIESIARGTNNWLARAMAKETKCGAGGISSLKSLRLNLHALLAVVAREFIRRVARWEF